MFHTMGMLVPELIEALVDLDLPVDSSIDLSLSSGLNYHGVRATTGTRYRYASSISVT